MLADRAFLASVVLVDILVARILPSPRLLKSMTNPASVLWLRRACANLCSNLQVCFFRVMALIQLQRWHRRRLLLLARHDLLQFLGCDALNRLQLLQSLRCDFAAIHGISQRVQFRLTWHGSCLRLLFLLRIEEFGFELVREADVCGASRATLAQ